MNHASLPSRALAAIIDYIVVMAAVIPAWSLVPDSDWQFLAPLVVGSVYFSLAHSKLLRGQSLGKRLFGLRVYSAQHDGVYLGVTSALLRYWATFGIIILLAELPPVALRHFGTIAHPLLLEMHMLFAMLYFTNDIACLVLSPKHQALHDLLAGSVVVRLTESSAQTAISSQTSLGARRFLYFRFFIGTTVGLLLWMLSTFHTPVVSEVARYRYQLENEFNVRIVSVGAVIVPLDAATTTATEARYKLDISLMPTTYREDLPVLSQEIAKRLLAHSAVAKQAVELITFNWLDAMSTLPEKRREQPLSVPIDINAIG